MRHVLKNYSLFSKVLLGVALAGGLTWAVLDYFQTRYLRDIFSAEMSSRLEDRAFQNRQNFDRTINNITQTLRLISDQSSVHRYIADIAPMEGDQQAGEAVQTPLLFDKSPIWISHLPRTTDAVLVLDSQVQLRETYNIHAINLPQRLFTTTALILRLSDNQFYLLEEDERLFIIISTPIVLPDGRRPATLMYVTEINATLMLVAHGPARQSDGITSFISGEPARVLVSADPVLIPPGTPLAELERDYMIVGKTYLDYGMSELRSGFASFLPRESFSDLVDPVSTMVRQQRTLTAFIISVAFIIPMLMVLRNLRQLSNRVTGFMEQVFDTQPQGRRYRDELYILNTEFLHLTDEVQSSRRGLQQEAERLRDKSEEHRMIAAQLMEEKVKSEAVNQELLLHRSHLEELVNERTERLKTALEQEKEYNALQRKLVSLVSHEFRTPLTIIDGAAQRLIRRKELVTADELVARAGKIREGVERMTKMIDTTLYASQLDAGKIEVHLEPCDISRVVRVVCSRQAEVSKGHDFSVDIDALPKEVMADCKLLEQVFTNILSNAAKYAPDGSLIEVFGCAEPEWAVVSITDHGIGIPAEDIPNMFKRYVRASNTVGIQGTGIGLSISKEFIDLHGGHITVESEEGKGASFTVRLPIGTT